MFETTQKLNDLLSQLDHIAMSIDYIADASKEEDVHQPNAYFILLGLAKSVREVEAEFETLITGRERR